MYAYLFFAFAWYEWHGAWAALIAIVFAVEVVITLADFIVEDQTRHLPKLERVLHTLLAMNVGAVLIILAPILIQWWSAPTAIRPVGHGAISWVFTVFSAGVLAWSLRNALAVLHHRRPPEWVHNPLKVLATPSGRTVLITGATGCTLRRPLWLRIPAWVLRNTLGEMAQLLVDGQRVVPHQAVTAGFVFQYSESGAALRQLLGSSPLKSVLRRQSVYYNGACPVCRTEMNHYARRCEATAAPVTFIDSSIQYDALVEYGLRPDHLKRRVYLKSANGQVLSGVAALASLWAQTPGYEWLSKLVSLPLLRSVAEALYDHIAVPVLVALERWRRAEPAHHGRIFGS